MNVVMDRIRHILLSRGHGKSINKQEATRTCSSTNVPSVSVKGLRIFLGIIRPEVNIGGQHLSAVLSLFFFCVYTRYGHPDRPNSSPIDTYKQMEKKKRNLLFQESFQLFGLLIERRLHVQVVGIFAVFVHLERGIFQLCRGKEKKGPSNNG